MGIWYDVSVHATGDVIIENPNVVTKLNLPSTDKAQLSISAEVRNEGRKRITGTLKGTIDNITFSKEVTIDPGEMRYVSFKPENFPQLNMDNPVYGGLIPSVLRISII